jgi:hypothetical protein
MVATNGSEIYISVHIAMLAIAESITVNVSSTFQVLNCG